MSGSTAALLALFFALMPAQTRQASRMALEVKQDACTGLSPAECCAQRLELAGFRATGDQIAKGAKTPLRLSCADTTQVVPEGACRSIAFGRGLPVKDVSALCESATLPQRCDASSACKTCVADLEKLHFSEPARACLPVTYTAKPATEADTVIILREDGNKNAANGGGIEIRKRRIVVR